VKFLLSRGGDVDALIDTGTPISLASFKGHTVKILLQHNADVLFKMFFDLFGFQLQFSILLASCYIFQLLSPVFKGITGR
jgi:hypothetical protein